MKAMYAGARFALDFLLVFGILLLVTALWLKQPLYDYEPVPAPTEQTA